jgi:hypothetical protein
MEDFTIRLRSILKLEPKLLVFIDGDQTTAISPSYNSPDTYIFLTLSKGRRYDFSRETGHSLMKANPISKTQSTHQLYVK